MGRAKRRRGRRSERVEELGVVAPFGAVRRAHATVERHALKLLALLPRDDLQAGVDPALQRRMVDQRAFEIGRAEIALALGKLEERAKAGVGLDVFDALRDERVQLETGGAAGNARPAPLAEVAFVDARPASPAMPLRLTSEKLAHCTWPGGAVGIARVHRLADAEPGFEPGHPGGLGRDRAYWFMKREVEAHREVLDAAALRRLEREREERRAGRSGPPATRCSAADGAAVEIGELAIVGEDDRHPQVERDVVVEPDVGAGVETRRALVVLATFMFDAVKPPDESPGLAALPMVVSRRMCASSSRVLVAERQVQIEDVVAVERVDDVGHLAGLGQHPRLADLDRLVGVRAVAARGEHARLSRPAAEPSSRAFALRMRSPDRGR